MFSAKTFFAYILRKNIKRPNTSNTDKPRVLLVAYDAIGDMAMTVPLFNALKEKVPNWQLEVLASPRNFDLIKEHPALQHVWVLDINKSFGKLDDRSKIELQTLYKEKFDILIYLGERINSATLWRLSKICATERLSLPYTKKTCLHKGLDPLKSKLFDRYIGLDYEQEVHMSKRMLSILSDLNIVPPLKADLSLYLPQVTIPHITFPQSQLRILLNPNGSRENNSLSEQQVHELIQELNHLSLSVCLFDTSENRQLTNNITDPIYWLSSETILMAAQWLKEVDLILTTDTSIGHIAAALSKPTVMMRSEGPNCCEPLSDYVTMIRHNNSDIKTLPTTTILNTIQKSVQLYK